MGRIGARERVNVRHAIHGRDARAPQCAAVADEGTMLAATWMYEIEPVPFVHPSMQDAIAMCACSGSGRIARSECCLLTS
jgi:hypothetical protein